MDEQQWTASRCDECGHVFTTAEMDAEDREAWGHPCYTKRVAKGRRMVCESYRLPVTVSPSPDHPQEG